MAAPRLRSRDLASPVTLADRLNEIFSSLDGRTGALEQLPSAVGDLVRQLADSNERLPSAEAFVQALFEAGAVRDLVVARAAQTETDRVAAAEFATIAQAAAGAVETGLSSIAPKDIVVTAAIPLGGGKVVRMTPWGAALASSADQTHAGAILGVTVDAADAGEPVAARERGELEDSSWTFTIGPVFAGVDGVMTQTPPTAGFVRQVGMALSQTTLNVALGAPIMLA